MRYLILFVLLASFPISAFGQAKMPQIQIVFFTPADVDAPAGVSRRLTQVADYTEAMLVKWMKVWDYSPKREQIFQRNSDGSVKILFVKSPETLASGKFPLKGGNLSRKGKLLAVQKFKIPKNLDVWWVWVYVGDPPMKYSSYLGAGSAATGGLSQVNYTNLPGEISPADKLAKPFLKELTLKGTIHEFGHALGLPHNGPLVKLDLGMPLMGATIANYRRVMKNREARGYVTEASAAILWKHPLFTGTAHRRYLIPKVEWHAIAVKNDHKKRVAHLTGRITSNIPAHSIIVYDTAPDVRTQYFQKPYVARVEKDGTFDITISEPVSVQAKGVFKIVACCENGTMTGDGKDRGLKSAHEIKYRTSRTGYQLIK
ncbi:hypothetical protein [uncultured Gimesia sp.]|uniref:hypothetical protein n=1 Tax=uncultured Gimesia sp. TaxID=1678688 RepID=UPI00260F87B7|nr:hypothetical protein [uncultured Gimesia sp.]